MAKRTGKRAHGQAVKQAQSYLALKARLTVAFDRLVAAPPRFENAARVEYEAVLGQMQALTSR